MDHDIFISYASEDELVAAQTCEYLESQGLRCWAAYRDNALSADQWMVGIIDAINTARVFLLVYSTASNSTKHVVREIERADNNGVPLVTLKIENVQPSKAIEYYVSSQQWIDASSGMLDEHLEGVADQLRRLLQKAPAASSAARQPQRQQSNKRSYRVQEVLIVVATVLALIALRQYGSWNSEPAGTAQTNPITANSAITTEGKELTSAQPASTQPAHIETTPDTTLSAVTTTQVSETDKLVDKTAALDPTIIPSEQEEEQAPPASGVWFAVAQISPQEDGTDDWSCRPTNDLARELRALGSTVYTATDGSGADSVCHALELNDMEQLIEIATAQSAAQVLIVTIEPRYAGKSDAYGDAVYRFEGSATMRLFNAQASSAELWSRTVRLRHAEKSMHYESARAAATDKLIEKVRSALPEAHATISASEQSDD